jgi:pantothenate kinase type III
MDVVLCIDIGNKNVKTGVFQDNRLDHVFVGFPERKLVEKAKSIVLSSVSDSRLGEFLVLLRNWGMERKLLRLRASDQNFIKVNYEDPDKLGDDRIALAFYLMSYHSSAIGVDAGTFINVEYVRDRMHFPMVIFPGIHILKDCFKRGERLKNLEIPLVILNYQSRCDKFPQTSEECMEYGLIFALRGIIKGVMDVTGCKNVVFTGGDGEILRNLSGFGAYEENAVILGLYEYYKLLSSRSIS